MIFNFETAFVDLKMWFIGLAHLHWAGAACFELIFVLCTFYFGLQLQRIAGWMARWTPNGKHPDARECTQGSLAGITARCGCRHLAAQKKFSGMDWQKASDHEVIMK